MTVYVGVDDDTIVEAPPVVRRFVGQPVSNLVEWMLRQGGLRWTRTKG